MRKDARTRAEKKETKSAEASGGNVNCDTQIHPIGFFHNFQKRAEETVEGYVMCSKDDTSMPAQICTALDDSVGDAAVRESLQILFRLDKAQFCQGALDVLSGHSQPSRSRLLALVLLSNNLLIEAVTDPALTSLDTAVAIVKNVIRSGAPVDAMLEETLGLALQRALTPKERAATLRTMDLLAAIGANSKLLFFQTQLTTHSDPMVRSKAALLIPKCSNNTAWVARLLADTDARVQANAIEALWSLDATPCRALLLASAKSRYHRVAANAAIGLYRLGDVTSIPAIFEMARANDPCWRSAGYWAMATTRDARFLPFLSAEYERCAAEDRAAILRAMTCIRRGREGNAEHLDIRIFDTKVGPDHKRSVRFSALSPNQDHLSCLKPTDISIWEGSRLVEQYAIAARRHAPLLLVGFVLPRFLSITDPHGLTLIEAFNRAIRYRRRDDLWRIDKYSVDPKADDGERTQESGMHGYDPAIVAPGVKVRRGFLCDSHLLRQVVSAPGPKDLAARDLGAAMLRLSDALCKVSGSRHAFVFAAQDSANASPYRTEMDALKAILESEGIALHGFACGSSAVSSGFSELCKGSPGGTFTDVPMEQLPAAVEQRMFEISDGFEVNYSAPAQGELSDEARLVISSSIGCGTAVFPVSAPVAS